MTIASFGVRNIVLYKFANKCYPEMITFATFAMVSFIYTKKSHNKQWKLNISNP